MAPDVKGCRSTIITPFSRLVFTDYIWKSFMPFYDRMSREIFWFTTNNMACNSMAHFLITQSPCWKARITHIYIFEAIFSLYIYALLFFPENSKKKFYFRKVTILHAHFLWCRRSTSVWPIRFFRMIINNRL